MALDNTAATAVANAIVTALHIGDPPAPPGAYAIAVVVWTSIVEAIFAGIKTGAVVTPTLLVAPSGGGPVTGTGTIT